MRRNLLSIALSTATATACLLSLSNVAAAGSATLADIRIDDVTANEGQTGYTAFDFVIHRTHSHDEVILKARTLDLSALADNDYVPLQDLSITLPAGGPSSTVLRVQVRGDTTFEATQSFAVQLYDAVGGNLFDGYAEGTIVNDDTARVVIDAPAMVEGQQGSTPMVFNVTLEGTVEGGFELDYQTADGTATAGSDYIASAGTLLFQGLQGEIRQLSVPILGDTQAEPDEHYTVELQAPRYRFAHRGAMVTGTGTIRDDDQGNGDGAADLDLSIDNGLGSLSRGQEVVYVVEVRNRSTADVQEAWVDTGHDGQLESLQWTCTASPGASCANSGEGNIQDLVRIPQGGTLHYRWTGVVRKDAGNRQLSADASVQVLAPRPDPHAANDQASDTDPLLQ